MRASSMSPSTKHVYGLKRVCEAWKISRSAIYARRKVEKAGKAPMKRGPKPQISDAHILKEVRRDINESPFHGEGHRKVHARIRKRRGIVVGRERVRMIMGKNALLSPYRTSKGKSKTHDGKIITEAPNDMWATDATKVDTVEDGMVWFFGIIEHWNAECLGWRVSKNGNRFVAIDALTMAIQCQYGSVDRDCAKGLSLRPDHGSQFLSRDYRNQMRYWGITPSFSFVREPETNGVVERFHRTFKEQIVHGRIYQNIKEFELAVTEFIKNYNNRWILEKLGYQSPIEARRRWEIAHAV